MNALGQALVWCALQVTLVAAAAGIVYVGLRRRGPAVRSLVALTALAVFVGLALAALSPWPRWTVVASARSGDSASAGSEREIARPADGTETPSLAAAPGGQAALAPSFIETAGSFWQAFVDELERRPIAAEHEPGVTGGTGWTWRSILAVLFAAGVALGGLRLIAAGLAVAAYRRFSRRVDDAQASRVAAQLCAELGCRRPVELRECPQLGSAAMLGWRRPLVLLPSGWRAWSEAELRAVLAHEIAHVRRGDFAAWALAQLGLILHFYHPLVHWLAARLRLDQELAADAAAAGVAGGRQPYLRILAEMALRQPDRPVGWPARAFLPTRKTFLRRIEMLRTTKQVPAAASRRLCVATVGVLVLAGLAAAGLRGSGGVLGQAAAAQAEDESRSRAAQPQAGRDADAARGADAAQGTLTAEGRVGAFDTSYVPAEALGFIAVRPAAILARPEMKPFIELLGSEGGVQTPLGLPLQEIEQLSFTLIPPLQPERRSQALFLPFGAMTARATRAHDFREFLQKAAPDAVRIPTMGREFFRSREGEGLAYFRPDDRTLVVGSVQDIARMIGAGPGTTWRWPSDDATAAALTGAHYVTLVDTALFKSLLEQAEAEATLQSVRARREAERAGLRGVGLPWYAAMAQMKLLQAAYSPLWEQTKSITFALKLGEELSVEWLFDSENEADGQAVRRTIDALLTLARNMSASAAEMARQEAAGRAEEPLLVAVLKLAQELLDNAKLEQDGAHVRLATSGSLGGEQANAVAALTESVKAARAAARRTQSMNNLKQIALAFHNYHDVYGRFPPAVLYGEDGKTPHSWRVAILPFIEQARLYEQYRFNEPWDSEHNRTILAQIPDVYRHPDEPSDGTNASYFALVGEKTVFTGAKAPRNEAGTRVSQITDGTSNTLLVVEAKRQIPWTKPEDIPFDPGNELPKLGGYTEGGFNAALCDGSVRFLSNAIQETVLRALITRGGGEPIRYEDLEPRR